MVRRLSAVLVAGVLLVGARSAAAAVAIDATTFRDLVTASTTIATPAFSTTAGGELLLAFVATDLRGGTSATVQTVSGGGLTWTLVSRSNVQRGGSEIWRAFAPAALANVTVTATTSQSVVSSMTVMSFTGVDPSGTNGSGAVGAVASANAASGAPTATLVTTRNGSWVFGVGNDHDKAVSRTAAAGQTLVHQVLSSVGSTYWVQRQNAPTPTAGTSVRINDTAPTADSYNLSICEILPAPVPTTFNLSGTLSPAAAASGATVTLAGTLLTAVADASGRYTITGVPNGSYLVTPRKAGFSFTPVNQSATVNGADLSGVNFTAQALTYTVSGVIAPAAAGNGATVTLSGLAGAIAVADAAGNYAIAGVPNGTYTAAASKSGFSFSPASQPVTVSGAIVTGINFTGLALTGNISGAVTPATLAAGATITISETAQATTVDSSGNYTLFNVPNGAYSLSATKAGVTFSPPTQPVTVSGAAVAGINFTAQALTYTVSGVISPAAAGNGATVTLSGLAGAVAVADAAGNYAITGLPNGTYTATASKSGFSFSPASQPVTVSGAIVTGINFTGLALTGSISGTVTPAALGAGATITISETAQATTVDSSGNYTLLNVPNGAYSLSATKAGFTFSPPTQPVTVSGAAVAGINFTAQALTYTVSGVIAPAAAGNGATVTLSGLAGAVAVADAAGNYAIAGVPNGAYTATASKSGFSFSPASQPVTVSGAIVTGINFTGLALTGNISGTVTPATLAAGATITISETAQATTVDSSGNYTLFNVPNGAYSLSATKAGVTFSPPTQPVTVSGAAVAGINFTAQPLTYTVSGVIAPAAAGNGATVTLSGLAGAIAVADAAGNYAITGVPDGTYTASASKSGFSFLPATRPVTVSGAAVTGVNFTAQALTFNISGTVTPAALGAGATITISETAQAATVDSSGNYTLLNVPNGVYHLSATKAGVTFSPPTQAVTVSGTAVTGINFTGQALTVSAIKLIQTAVNGSEFSTAAISATFPAANTAGNFLIVTGTAARPAGTLTISDTAGNVYLPAIGPVSDVPQNVTAYVWYVPKARGGANTVTVTPSSPRALEIHVSEWSGVAATGSVDQTAVATGFGTKATTGLRTPTMDGELIFGYTFIGNSATPGAGFTTLTLVNGDLDEYRIQQAAAPVEATFTQSSGDWFVMMATFRPFVIDTTAPTVTLDAPVSGASVAGLVTVSASATDNVGVVGVQFQLDGVNLGPELTAAPYSLSWNTATASEGPHTLTAVARDAAANRITSSATSVVVLNNTTGPAAVGSWSAPFDVGLVAVNMAMLHTGKVLMFSGTFATGGIERVWDPATGTVTLVPNPFYNLFCAGQSQLGDGRILVVGGFDSNSLGAANANIFDPVAQSWSALPNMSFRRWYPSSTTLPDGRALVTSGAQTCLTCIADVPEIFDPATGRFTTVPTARLAVPYYPFMFVLPDGTVVDAGANENPVATSKFDPAARTWTSVDPVVRDGHSAAMYLPGKILKTGTAADSGTPGNAAATAFVIDMTQPAPAWRQIASMAFPRAFQNTTLLPDGTALVTGGGTALDGYDVTKSVKAAELWSPATETWRTLAAAAIPRLYHSTALLLPDGRVLTAGSGNDGPAVNQTQAELFSPPYLFKGARPTIASAPATAQYGSTISVQTPDAASIASVSLVRPGAVTHGFDEDQRFLSLAFTAGAGTLTVQTPANANLAPPGYYMLFLVNTAGVPSVASFVQFAAVAGDVEPPSAPTGLAGQGSIGSATVAWTASTDNTGVALYNVHSATTSGFLPSAANRLGQATSTSFTHTGASAGIHYYVATAQDVAGNVSLPSNEAAVLVTADTTPPSIAFTAPASQATLSGSVTVSASASDDVGIAGVQFQLDGNALGAERTTPPYAMAWSTPGTANGSHTLTAVARDAAGNRTSASVDVVVSNTSQAPGGLVAAYGFNETSGVQVIDASSQNNTGTISSAIRSTTGKFGGALSFNGTSAWVTVADAPSLDLTTGMTLEAWVNPTTVTAWRTVILKEVSAGLAYSLYAGNSASRAAGFVHIGSDIAVNGTTATPLNTWTHLAVTYDGATLRMFVNGSQVSSLAVAGGTLVSSGALRIGGNSVWGEYFRGLIDEVRVYNRALTATEIQTDMNTPIP